MRCLAVQRSAAKLRILKAQLLLLPASGGVRPECMGPDERIMPPKVEKGKWSAPSGLAGHSAPDANAVVAAEWA
jgi:hypothetical protein